MKYRKKLLAGLFILLFVFALTGPAMKAEASGKYTIYVNRKSNIVNVVNRRGKLVRSMYCSTGVRYATIKGTFHTQNRLRWHILSHGVYGQYCTRISGPYLFHSVWYYSTRKNSLSIKQYNKLGSQASMGCVRLAVVDAKWIYDHCPRGTKVVIGESKKLFKPSRPKITLSMASGTGWDPTDPDPSNPYYPKIKLKKGVNRKLAYGSSFDPLEMIAVSSKITKKKKLIQYVKVKGEVNTSVPGKYKLIYKVTDPATQLSRSLKVTFKVADAPIGEKTTEATTTTQVTKPTQAAKPTQAGK